MSYTLEERNMTYLFWDTERIKGSQIYLLGYILADENCKTIKEEIVINTAVDISQRKSPQIKVMRLDSVATKVNDFHELANIILPLIKTSRSVCFGKDDFAALNNQLYANGIVPLSGTFYDVEGFVRNCNEKFPKNLKDVSKFLKLNHDRHNPLSDSRITMEYFKFLTEEHSKERFEAKIPDKKPRSGE